MLIDAAVPMVQWDTSTYLMTMRDQLRTELTAELTRLFSGYSGKDKAFSTDVIAQVRAMVGEVMLEVNKEGEGQDLFDDAVFNEKLRLFKYGMERVAARLAEGAQHKTSFHQRPESNRTAVSRDLEVLVGVKDELIKRIKYVHGEASPEQQRRTSAMEQQQARDAILKRFREFVQEMRKDPKVRTRPVDQLYEEASVIELRKNGYLSDEQSRTFAVYRSQIEREKGMQDGKATLLKGGRAVLLEIPMEGGGVVHFEHRPQRTMLVPGGGTFHGVASSDAW